MKKRLTKAERKKIRREVSSAVIREMNARPGEFPPSLAMPDLCRGDLNETTGTFIIKMAWSGRGSEEAAAVNAGIHPATLRRWKQRGKEGKAIWYDFWVRLEIATGHGCLELESEGINTKSPQFIRWILSLRRPDIYGEVQDDDGKVVIYNLPHNART